MKVVRRVSAINVYDTIDRSAVKIHRRVFISCCRAKACNFSGLVNILFWNFPRETIPVERATQQWRSIRKTTSCKKTPESPGCSSSLTGQKKIRSRQFKRFWNWFGKSKCPGSLLNLIVNFQHEHFIVPTSCPWVFEDALKEILLMHVQLLLNWVTFAPRKTPRLVHGKTNDAKIVLFITTTR